MRMKCSLDSTQKTVSMFSYLNKSKTLKDLLNRTLMIEHFDEQQGVQSDTSKSLSIIYGHIIKNATPNNTHSWLTIAKQLGRARAQ